MNGPEVTQADREAAASLFYTDTRTRVLALEGAMDRGPLIQAFACHREASVAAAVTERDAQISELTEALRKIAERAKALRAGTDDWFELVEFEQAATAALMKGQNDE